MSDNFRVSVGSDSEFEDLVAELEVGDYYVGTISMEEGYEKLKIHMPLGIGDPTKTLKRDACNRSQGP
jgi:hypothetical protein